MKFDSRKPVDIMRWTAPIKLNRKDLRKDDPANAVAAVPQAVGPMLGPDGKPVIGIDGRMVMVDAEGKPIHDYHLNGGASGQSGSGAPKDKGKGVTANGKKRFQKKTKQVFLVPEEVRQLRREERYPWVMEDSSPNKEESWVGHLEEVSKAETHGFFMPAANDAFKFVPAHRWYKFQKKLKHDLPTDTANVESLVGDKLVSQTASWDTHDVHLLSTLKVRRRILRLGLQPSTGDAEPPLQRLRCSSKKGKPSQISRMDTVLGRVGGD